MSVKDKAAAIDRFVRTIKASGVYDDIQAACIMAGWTNLAGALYPLKGAAPTNNGFLAADLDAGIGLKGDGSSKWIGTNRLGTADNQNDVHQSAYMSAPAPAVVGGSSRYIMGDTDSGNTNAILQLGGTLNESFQSIPSGAVATTGTAGTAGFRGMNRTSSTALAVRSAGTGNSGTVTSVPRSPNKVGVYASAFGVASSTGLTDATLAWYSIGSATDLAALDSAVSTLMADLRAIDEAGFDRDALAYIRNVEAADGAYLETGVKQAINAFVVGCKKDGIWDAIKASCIMCGARTISGALVPLVGPSPTAYPQPVNFVSADYDRSSGLKGDGATKYLDSNRANNADPQNDFHIATYATAGGTGTGYFIGSRTAASAYKTVGYAIWSRSAAATASGTPSSAGMYAVSRSSASAIQYIKPPSSTTPASVAAVADAPYSTNDFVFAFVDSNGAASNRTDARLAFYSIGSSLDLAALDTRVSTLVAAIAAAI